MSILQTISLIVTLLPAILRKYGVIPAPVATLITELGTEIPTQIMAISAGTIDGPTATMLAILQGIQVELETIRKANFLDDDALALSVELTKGIDAALVSWADTSKTTDPENQIPILPTDL